MTSQTKQTCNFCALLHAQTDLTDNHEQLYQNNLNLLKFLKNNLNIKLKDILKKVQSAQKKINILQQAQKPQQNQTKITINFPLSDKLKFASAMHHIHQDRLSKMTSVLHNHLMGVDLALGLFIYAVTAMQIIYICSQYLDIVQSHSLSSFVGVLVTYLFFYFAVIIFVCWNRPKQLSTLEKIGWITINIFMLPFENLVMTYRKYKKLQIQGIYLLLHQKHYPVAYSLFLVKSTFFLTVLGIYLKQQLEQDSPIIYNIDLLAILFSLLQFAFYPIMDFRYYMNTQPQSATISSWVQDKSGYQIQVPIITDQVIFPTGFSQGQQNDLTTLIKPSTKYQTNSQRQVSELITKI